MCEVWTPYALANICITVLIDHMATLTARWTQQAIKGCAVSCELAAKWLQSGAACFANRIWIEISLYTQNCCFTCQVFVELEIPHVYHSVARNSPKRQELIDKWDVFQVPYIEVSTGLFCAMGHIMKAVLAIAVVLDTLWEQVFLQSYKLLFLCFAQG